MEKWNVGSGGEEEALIGGKSGEHDTVHGGRSWRKKKKEKRKLTKQRPSKVKVNICHCMLCLCHRRAVFWTEDERLYGDDTGGVSVWGEERKGEGEGGARKQGAGG